MSSFKDLRIVDNFYQTSLFFPMPTVLVSTLTPDGKTSIGDQMATFIEWTAKNGGECPIGFGLVANTRWYTSSNHRYVFSDIFLDDLCQMSFNMVAEFKLG